MSGGPISALNDAVRLFRSDLQSDRLAHLRVELAVIAFGGTVRVLQPFASVDHFAPGELVADGTTPMGEAITMAVQMLKARKAEYRANGIAYFRPWILLVTDGEPTDAWQSAAQLVRAEVAAKGLVFFAVGVANANMHVLGAITDRVIKLDGLRFRELFKWLSDSQKSLSASRPGELAALAPAGSFAAPY
jgi:uncharacterized protein YegL